MPRLKRDGVELHYELDGSGPPVVYISGFSDHSNSLFGQTLRHTLAERYTVLAVDNRGSGQTVTPEGARATGEELADDIAAIMDHHRTGAAHLLGISMGGSIALMLSLCHPQMVRSQVAAVSVARIPYPSRTTFMLETTRLMQDAGVPHALVMRDALIGLWGEEVFPHTDVIDFVVNAPPDPWEQTRAGFDLQIDALRRYDIRARLGDIHTPTLIVSSPDDIIVPTHFQRELAHGIPGAEFKEYPGGHVFMMLPMYYQSFVDDVVAFWEKHS